MANTLLTPDIIAREALMVLRNNAVMAKLVHRDYSGEFVSGVGDTITIRKPATFVAKEFTNEIELQDATESGIEVKMDKHLDVSFSVTSKEMTLSIENFSKQFIIPAMQSFNDAVDKYLLGLYADITAAVGDGTAAPTSIDWIVDAGAQLNKAKAPMTERRLVLDPLTEAAYLKQGTFHEADKVGDNGTALREASLGRKFGFDTYMDQNVIEKSGVIQNLAFHKNAFALVTRPLALPSGAAKAAIVNYDGFGLRVVYGYDMTKKTDIVSIDMLCGVKTLNKDLAVKLLTKAGAANPAMASMAGTEE